MYHADRQRRTEEDGPFIYVADPAVSVCESGRAIGIALLGIESAGPATFLAPAAEGASLKKAWDGWLADPFEACLGEIFLRIHGAAGRMHIDTAIDLDRRIGSFLPPAAAARSRSAARPFLEGRFQARHQPQWLKFARAVDSGEAPGHVTSLFALQASLYHLPLLPALVSYAYFEWKSGLETLPEGGNAGADLSTGRFQTGFPESVAAVRRIFEKHAGESSPFLRL